MLLQQDGIRACLISSGWLSVLLKLIQLGHGTPSYVQLHIDSITAALASTGADDSGETDAADDADSCDALASAPTAVLSYCKMALHLQLGCVSETHAGMQKTAAAENDIAEAVIDSDAAGAALQAALQQCNQLLEQAAQRVASLCIEDEVRTVPIDVVLSVQCCLYPSIQ